MIIIFLLIVKLNCSGNHCITALRKESVLSTTSDWGGHWCHLPSDASCSPQQPPGPSWTHGCEHRDGETPDKTQHFCPMRPPAVLHVCHLFLPIKIKPGLWVPFLSCSPAGGFEQIQAVLPAMNKFWLFFISANPASPEASSFKTRFSSLPEVSLCLLPPPCFLSCVAGNCINVLTHNCSKNKMLLCSLCWELTLAITSSSLLLSRRYHSSGIYFKEAFLFLRFISVRVGRCSLWWGITMAPLGLVHSKSRHSFRRSQDKKTLVAH